MVVYRYFSCCKYLCSFVCNYSFEKGLMNSKLLQAIIYCNFESDQIRINEVNNAQAQDSKPTLKQYTKSIQ